jgi:hypothetical protein
MMSADDMLDVDWGSFEQYAVERCRGGVPHPASEVAVRWASDQKCSLGNRAAR